MYVFLAVPRGFLASVCGLEPVPPIDDMSLERYPHLLGRLRESGARDV